MHGLMVAPWFIRASDSVNRVWLQNLGAYICFTGLHPPLILVRRLYISLIMSMNNAVGWSPCKHLLSPVLHASFVYWSVSRTEQRSHPAKGFTVFRPAPWSAFVQASQVWSYQWLFGWAGRAASLFRQIRSQSGVRMDSACRSQVQCSGDDDGL